MAVTAENQASVDIDIVRVMETIPRFCCKVFGSHNA